MIKYELAPTKENIIKTLKDDSIYRNREVAEFIQLLDNIEGNASISIDADWGNGKTFFVKQTEIILENLRQERINDGSPNGELKIITDKILYNKEIENIFIPIYYDAWLYDDHQNVIESLIFNIISQGFINKDRTKSSGASDKLAALFESLLALRNVNIDIKQLFSSSSNAISGTYNIENEKSLLRNIFTEIINENCTKLIVFIDELDRCNPSFAISLLEKIKHFFDDDRIIFVYSTNKAQLVYTIRKYYGAELDATSYLNRFFDFQFTLGNVDIEQYLLSIDEVGYYNKMAQNILIQVVKYYGFTIREFNICYAKYKEAEELFYKTSGGVGIALIIFCTIGWCLGIKDIEKQRAYMNNKLESEVDLLFDNVVEIKEVILRVLKNSEDDENVKQIFLEMYHFVFGERQGFFTFGDSELDERKTKAIKNVIRTCKI